MHPGRLEQGGAEAEPARGVVIAADHDGAGPGAAQPAERLVAERDRVDRRQRAVVDVAGHDDHVDALGAHRLDQVVDIGRLTVEQALPVERPPQMPVRGMQDPHSQEPNRSH